MCPVIDVYPDIIPPDSLEVLEIIAVFLRCNWGNY